MYFSEFVGINKYKIVTKSPAPLLIPIIPVSAKSFLVIICNSPPAIARENPVIKSIITLGSRMEKIIKFSLKFPFPIKVINISFIFIEEYPREIPKNIEIIKKIIKSIKIFFLFSLKSLSFSQ